MKRSPLALALVATLGAALPAAPVLAQQGASRVVMPIRTGSSSIPGALGVRLAVYDRQSFELSWNRVSGAATYRLAVGGRTVQDNGGLSRYVAGVDLSGGFDYVLTALDRSGKALAAQRFRVQPASAPQLLPGSPGTAPTTPTNPMAPVVNDGPIRIGQTSLAGDIAVRLAVYDAQSYELFWERVPGAVRYQLSLSGGTVQESDAVSHFTNGADPAKRFDYTLLALDRSGAVLRRTSFTVAPRGVPQLTTFVPGPVPVKPPSGPGTTPTPTTPGAAGDSPFVPVALAAPLLASVEPGSPLSVANHETFVRAFYDIAEPRVLDTLLRQTEAVQAELQGAAAGTDSRFVAESTSSTGGTGSEIVFACPDGGTVRAVFGGAGASASTTLMDFRRCALGGDTLSGVTREAPGGRTDQDGRIGTDRTFGGYRLEILRYPFMGEAIGLGAEGERFTIETGAGLDTTVFGRVVRTSLDLQDGSTVSERSWRGNWQLDRAGATLLVTDLHADAVRYSDGNDEADRVKPYFVVGGTVTNGREITAVNQRDFVEIKRPSSVVYGKEVFRDARGGVMDLVAGPDVGEAVEPRTRVRIDTDGVILNRTLPAELDATPFLAGR